MTEAAEEPLARDRVFVAAEVVLLAHVAAVVLLFDPLLFDTFTLVKSAAAHVTGATLATLLVWLVIRRGWSVVGWTPVHVAVGAVVLAFAIASLFAFAPQIAVFGAWRRYLGLTNMVDCAIVYVGAVVLLRSRRAASVALVTGLLVTVCVLIYGTLQATHHDPVRYAQDTSHPISTLGNPDILGGYLSIAAATFGAVGVLLWRRLPRWLATASVVTAAACVALLATTTVRNGLLGLVAGLAAAVGVVLLTPGRSRVVIGTLVASLLLTVAVVLMTPIGQRLAPSYLQTDPSTESRIEIWRTALTQVQARPLVGVGPDNFGVAWYGLRSARSEQIYGPIVQNSTHSWFFYYLTSAGVVGLAAFLTALALAFLAAARLARAGDPLAITVVPLAAYLGQGIVDVNDVSLDWIAWLAFGILAGATAAPIVLRRTKRRRTERGPAHWLGWVAVAVVTLVALAVEVPRVAASQAESRAVGYLGIGAQADAIAPAAEAVRLDPRRAEYWSSLGTAYAGSNIGSALASFLEAARIAPYDPLHWMDISIEHRAGGNTAGALSAAKRAVLADPSSSDAHRLLASVYLDVERYADAATEGETAIRLWPAPQNFEEPILADIKLERWDEAVQLARRAVAVQDSPHYHLRLAQALTGAGRYAEARKELEIVLKATPDDPEARDLAAFLATKS